MSIAIQIGPRCYRLTAAKDLFKMIVNHTPDSGVLNVIDLPDEYCKEDQSDDTAIVSSN